MYSQTTGKGAGHCVLWVLLVPYKETQASSCCLGYEFIAGSTGVSFTDKDMSTVHVGLASLLLDQRGGEAGSRGSMWFQSLVSQS